MGGVGAFLVALAGPLARKVLLSLGIGVVTMVGVDQALGAMLGAARAAWAGVPGDVAGLLNLAGCGTAMAMISGAITARVALIPLKKLDLL